MPYIVQTASAKMPSSVRSRYGRIAIIEVENDSISRVSMISDCARGVRRIVQKWERQHMGSGSPRTAFSVSLAEAKRKCEMLNSIELGAPVWR